MAARLELGETDNPALLIPGNPASLQSTAKSLLDYSTVLDQAGDGLAGIATNVGWQGEAADAFRKSYHEQPPKWKQAAGAFHDTATALNDYVVKLAWAQGVAAEAITTWNAGKPYHQAATVMLDSARSQLASTAASTTDTVTAAASLAPPAPTFWSRLADIGDAIIHDPLAVAGVAGGAALDAVSLAGEGAGFALDATGVGAVVGVPLDVASAAGLAVGTGIAAAGVASIAKDAMTLMAKPEPALMGESAEEKKAREAREKEAREAKARAKTQHKAENKAAHRQAAAARQQNRDANAAAQRAAEARRLQEEARRKLLGGGSGGGSGSGSGGGGQS